MYPNSSDFSPLSTKTRSTSRMKASALILKPQQSLKASSIKPQIITTGKNPQNNEGYRPSLTREQLNVVNEDLFDQIIDASLHKPIAQAFEPIAKEMFQCEKCVLWIDNPDQNCLISPTYNLKAGYENTLPGFIFRTKSLIQVRDPSNTPNGFTSDFKLVKPKSPQLFFVLTAANISRAVVQVIQYPNAPSFTRTDIETANLIISKFSIYGNSIFTSQNISKIAESLYSYNVNPINPINLIMKHFHATICEVWQFDTQKEIGQKFIDAYSKNSSVNISQCGIVGNAVTNHRKINLSNASDDPNYNEDVDGAVPGPILCLISQVSRRESWAIVLRGRTSQFSATDEAQLACFFPFVLGSLNGFNSNDERSVLITQLTDLLEVAHRITHRLSIADLPSIIINESMKVLECETVNLFLVENNKEYINAFYYQNKQVIHKRFLIDKGICSHVIQTGGVISLLNPADSIHYNQENDMGSNQSYLSLLAGPIYNLQRTKVIGCLMAFSKKSEIERFTDSDKKALSFLNQFNSIAIENATLFKKTTELAKQMREYFKKSNSNNDLKPLFEDLLMKGIEVLKAERLSFFLMNSNQLYNLCNVGSPLKYGSVFSECLKDNTDFIQFSSDEIKEKINADNEVPTCIICIYIRDNDNHIRGVLECEFDHLISENEKLLLHSFSVISKLSIDQLTISEFGFSSCEFNLDDVMIESERSSTSTPSKLILENPDIIFTQSFDIDSYDRIAIFQIVFYIFNKFGLTNEFSITNEMLFNFTNNCLKCYENVDNWKHAVDTLQFMSLLISTGQIDRQYISKFDILALFISSLFSCISHQTDDNIVTQSTKIRQIKCVEAAISVLTNDDCDILHSLSDGDFETMIELISAIILSLHYRKHQQFVSKLKVLINSDALNPSGEKQHRILILQALMKISVISPLFRPFKEMKLDKLETLANTFYQEGNFEETNGMVFTSSEEDFQHLDAIASMIGFVKNICLPLSQLLSVFFSPLKSIFDTLPNIFSKLSTNREKSK